MALFRQELEERSAALVEGARLLLVGTIDAATIDDVIRDAHTIKGSARLMGNEPVASGAAVLERGWRALAIDSLEPTTEVASSLIDLAGQLGKALDVDGGPGEVAKALSLIHISEPTRRTPISYAVFCL